MEDKIQRRKQMSSEKKNSGNRTESEREEEDKDERGRLPVSRDVLKKRRITR